MKFQVPFPQSSTYVQSIQALRYKDEDSVVADLLASWDLSADSASRIQIEARDLVQRIRQDSQQHGGLDAFLHEFSLSSQEGVVLMCLAEALLRVPDKETVDKLIRDKIGDADWSSHIGNSDSVFVNASTWALMLTGKIVKPDIEDTHSIRGYLHTLVARNGEPVIRAAISKAMRIMGQQFVLAETIESALQKAEEKQQVGYRYSYDMLGEAARTAQDAQRYFDEYAHAIRSIGQFATSNSPVENPGISIKLSALHPRYEFVKMSRVENELYPRLRELAEMARSNSINMTIDAEESDRLDASLAIFERLAKDDALDAWDGLGLAVQAYQKRATAVIDWLIDLAAQTNRRFMVRLVKGAYWDTEIKRAQELGLKDYPVFTRKASTDVSYLVCAKKMFVNADAIYSQFATHNAHSVASIIELAGKTPFEFQCLHGMGEALYQHVTEQGKTRHACRIYAPVGPHKDLLAYLVRRLLENGANSSFVNRLTDNDQPIDKIVADPFLSTEKLETVRHPQIPVPSAIYGDDRVNSRGLEITDPTELTITQAAIGACNATHSAEPLIANRKPNADEPISVFNPAHSRSEVGTVVEAGENDIELALRIAHSYKQTWDWTPAQVRARYLTRAAEEIEKRFPEFIDLCTREAGKTLQDAVAEIREAVDFLRYYAVMASKEYQQPLVLPGPTGESNTLALHGRGLFVCISPWNFPLAIFCGQVSAALAAGNCVIAKPAEQTPLIAHLAVKIMHNAGIPEEALQLVTGKGSTIGAKLVSDERVDGVAFTGSTETAKLIQRALSNRVGAIVPLIAETGGQNAMLVDSTALPEQVVRDVVTSAFQSAGQRCSALRILFVQDDISDDIVRMLKGAMDELSTGDPENIAIDVGPIIDASALSNLNDHIQKMKQRGHSIYRSPRPESNTGNFFAPALIEIQDITVLEREVFGPILHLVRYKQNDLDKVIESINDTGYGLTLGIHSRINETVEYISGRIRAGNVYVNRNIIGAIVGSQPFGGDGLSGTGPKAGGPRYLHRFSTERSISVDTTASGGNASLMSMSES